VDCLTSGFAFWILWEYILYKERVEIDKAEHREGVLKDNNKVLEVQLSERINQLTLLQNKREEEQSTLTTDTNNLRIGNETLKQEIYQLKESLNSLSTNTDSIPLTGELKKTRLELLYEQVNNQLRISERSLLESQEREQQLKKRAQQAQTESQALAKEIENISTEKGQHSLNNFEVSIKNSLEDHFSSERVLTQFDVGIGRQGSKFTDFIIFMNNCCIVIEAKSYTGTIESVGNARNTGWTCQTETRKLYIYACWGENPYQQVKTYADSLYGSINCSKHSRKFPVYGIVVFPANSDIDNNIESNMGDFFRVTTLDNLIPIIQQLEHKGKFQNKSGLTYQQILQRLTGISNQQALASLRQ